MKTTLAILFLTLLTPALHSQEWFPIGASWHYNQVDFMLPGERFQYFEVLGDTIIQGKACRIVSGDCICKDQGVMGYLHQDGERIYYFDQLSEAFMLLYDFEMTAGDTMTYPFTKAEDTHYVLDSVTTVMFNGVMIRVQHWGRVDGWVEIGPRTYEFIGNTRCLYPQIGYCDPLTGPMRCYYDGDFGLIKFIDPDKDCDAVTSSTSDIDQPVLEVYPNPTSGSIVITSDHPMRSVICQSIATGQVALSTEPLDLKSEIRLDGLAPGIYLLNILLQDGSRVTQKVVVR
jgi:hypothetical protein